MKKFIALLLFLLPMMGFAQLTTIDPDTVCYQTPGSIYQVTNTPGYTYTWTVNAPGVLINGQGTNQINVDWSAAAPGLYPNAISVFATNANGCQSPPVDIDVFILQIIPTIAAIGPFCETDPCVPLVGNPAGGVWAGPGVVGNQFCPANAGVGNHNITYTITEGGCVFVANAVVQVVTLPTITPISHN
jgi:hypothetical protein